MQSTKNAPHQLYKRAWRADKLSAAALRPSTIRCGAHEFSAERPSHRSGVGHGPLDSIQSPMSKPTLIVGHAVTTILL